MYSNVVKQVALACISLCSASALMAAPMRFTNVTQETGIDTAHHAPPLSVVTYLISFKSGGAVAEDFDGDGWLDIYFVQGDPAVSNELYMNLGDGSFSNEAAVRGADLSGFGMGACAADYDNDGDIDIAVNYVSNSPLLLLNDGTGHFNVNSTMLMQPADASMSCSWGDIDNDGLLELLAGQWRHYLLPQEPTNLFLYKNNAGTLARHEFKVAPHQDLHVYAPRFADLNNDRLADLPVVADFWQSQLYLNRGDGFFDNVTASNGTGGSTGEQNGMGSAIGDYDNDGDLDWFVTSITNQTGRDGNRLYQNDGSGVFTDVTDLAGVRDGDWGWGAAFGDLDNDGDLDIFHVNGWALQTQSVNQAARLFENRGDGTFTNVAVISGADDKAQGRGVSLFDYDRDGDLDIFICNNHDVDAFSVPQTSVPSSPALLRNDSSNGFHWLQVVLDGTPPYHRDGIGSRVYLTVGTNTQMRELHASTHFMSQGPGRIAHFGLGTNEMIEEVRAVWVTGHEIIVSNVAADQVLSLPSPGAVLSSNVVDRGAAITFSAGSVTNPVRWRINEELIETNTFQQRFDTSGMKEIELQVLGSDSSTVLRTETYYLEVSPLVRTGISPMTGANTLKLEWYAESGMVFRLEATDLLMGAAWSNVIEPVTAEVNGLMSTVHTNSEALNYYRLQWSP